MMTFLQVPFLWNGENNLAYLILEVPKCPSPAQWSPQNVMASIYVWSRNLNAWRSHIWSSQRYNYVFWHYASFKLILPRLFKCLDYEIFECIVVSSLIIDITSDEKMTTVTHHIPPTSTLWHAISSLCFHGFGSWSLTFHCSTFTYARLFIPKYRFIPRHLIHI